MISELIGRLDLTTTEYDRMMHILCSPDRDRRVSEDDYLMAWLLAERSHRQVVSDLGIRVSPAVYKAMTSRHAVVEELLA